MSEHAIEIRAGQRFPFGKNWSSFLSTLDDDRISGAEDSLKTFLECETLQGKTFLDVGSGSGLFSLVARRLGAKVHSFDYDPQSVACTQELKQRYFPNDPDWTIQEGSILDLNFIQALGQFDIVYSWGVLFCTSDLWQALENIQILVKEGGLLHLAISNDQGVKSQLWIGIKRCYNANLIGKAVVLSLFLPMLMVRELATDIAHGQNPIQRYTDHKQRRGMSIVHDWFDWLGGYPFEVASAGAVFQYFRRSGFSLQRLFTTSSWGNNEFVFVRRSPGA